jgi:hypothetical protein
MCAYWVGCGCVGSLDDIHREPAKFGFECCVVRFFGPNDTFMYLIHESICRDGPMVELAVNNGRMADYAVSVITKFVE